MYRAKQSGSARALAQIRTGPSKNFREFAAFFKANAKTVQYASGGLEWTPHMASELLNSSLKVRVKHVPYKGENPAVVDLPGGQIPYMFSNFPVVIRMCRPGRLRAVPIASVSRSLLAPEFAAMAESGVPASTPRHGAGSTCLPVHRAKP